MSCLYFSTLLNIDNANTWRCGKGTYFGEIAPRQEAKILKNVVKAFDNLC